MGQAMSQCSEILILILLAATIVFSAGCYWAHCIIVRVAFQNEYYRTLLTDFARGRLSANYMTKLSKEALRQTSGLKEQPPDIETNHTE